MTGTQFVAGNDTERRIKLKYNYMVMCDWKAEREQALRAPHSKVDVGRHWIGEKPCTIQERMGKCGTERTYGTGSAAGILR